MHFISAINSFVIVSKFSICVYVGVVDKYLCWEICVILCESVLEEICVSLCDYVYFLFIYFLFVSS